MPEERRPSFSFRLPSHILVGEGLLSEAGRQARNLDLRTRHARPRAFLVTDPGVGRAGLSGAVLASLESCQFDCEVWNRVEPNPKDLDCQAGGEAARRFEADVVVAVGGGSVIDSAKAIALLQTNAGAIRDYEGRSKVGKDVPPIVAIPTTAGTGSEVTRSAVITDSRRKLKFTVNDIRLVPALALVDPETTYALPPAITASTGMDAFVHALEAFTCRVSSPVSDALAGEAMRLIFPALRRAVIDGKDRWARYAMMVGSTLAGLAFSHSDVAAVHCLAEALGGLYDTPHGLANSMFLPIVAAFNAPADPAKHARAAEACGISPRLGEVPSANLMVAEIRRLSADIGIPPLSSLPYVDPADFERLAEASFQNGSTPSNCRAVTKKDYLQLLEEAYGAEPGSP